MKERYVFIDADSLLYRAAYGEVSDKTMMQRYRDRLDYIRVHTFSTQDFVAIKGIGNFRMDVDPLYKAQRKPLEESMRRRLNTIANYAIEIGAVTCDGWEADDQVRAWSYEAGKEGIDWIISGIDKDLLQIPGTHFNYGGSKAKPIPEDEKWKFITQEEGDFRMACQLLTGDTIDNITGINRVGAVKAGKALADKTRPEMMGVIVEMYKKEFGDEWETKLHNNCNLIYMRRWLTDEFDYKVWLNE